MSLAKKNDEPLSLQKLTHLLSHPHRFADDDKRDIQRKPAQILAFSDVSVGDSILDLYAGGGWYTELFSLAVGDKGTVYAHNDQLTWRFGHKQIKQRMSNQRLPNVVMMDPIDLSEIDLPENSIDVAFMAINYHDLFFTHRYKDNKKQIMRQQVVDHHKALIRIKKLLKADGVLIISDHSAHAGSGFAAANNLHRIDANIVKFHLKQAGFQLLEEAFYLRNPDDDLNRSVFDPVIRGKTDRFVYKFAKK